MTALDMIKIHVDRFHANNPHVMIDDLIFNIKAGITKEGIVNVNFETKAKYYDVEANGTFSGPLYSGEVLRITPNIYDDESGSYLEDDMFDGAYDRYLKHPEYFCIELVIDHSTMGGRYFSSKVIGLKHEYFVSYIPDDYVMNYDCLVPVELSDERTN
jgi:hypothetical protein